MKTKPHPPLHLRASAFICSSIVHLRLLATSLGHAEQDLAHGAFLEALEGGGKLIEG